MEVLTLLGINPIPLQNSLLSVCEMYPVTAVKPSIIAICWLWHISLLDTNYLFPGPQNAGGYRRPLRNLLVSISHFTHLQFICSHIMAGYLVSILCKDTYLFKLRRKSNRLQYYERPLPQGCSPYDLLVLRRYVCGRFEENAGFSRFELIV